MTFEVVVFSSLVWQKACKDVNSEFLDIIEVHMNFQGKGSEESRVDEPSMPSLRKLVKPMDWQRLSAKVTNFADKAFWNPQLPPETLKHLTLRLPLMNDPYLRAQATLRSMGCSESGSKIWFYCKGFGTKSRSDRLQPSLDEIQEGIRSRRNASELHD